jgi:hypothetical protein
MILPADPHQMRDAIVVFLLKEAEHWQRETVKSLNGISRGRALRHAAQVIEHANISGDKP